MAPSSSPCSIIAPSLIAVPRSVIAEHRLCTTIHRRIASPRARRVRPFRARRRECTIRILRQLVFRFHFLLIFRFHLLFGRGREHGHAPGRKCICRHTRVGIPGRLQKLVQSNSGASDDGAIDAGVDEEAGVQSTVIRSPSFSGPAKAPRDELRLHRRL